MRIDDRIVWLSIACWLCATACEPPPCNGTREPSSGTCLRCGLYGMTCCTSTTPCQGQLFCSSGYCVGCQSTCASGTVCSSGRCVACGRAGAPCCSNAPQCQAELRCQSGQCMSCGHYGESCCDGTSCLGHLTCAGGECQGCQDDCAAGTTCQLGGCVACGQTGQPCCEGATPCTSRQTTCVALSAGGSLCTGCGGNGQPCCGLFTCDQTSGRSVCAHTLPGPTGYRCTGCGYNGAPCCEGEMPCPTGLYCDSMLTCVTACGGDRQPCCAGWPPCLGAGRCTADRCATPPSLAGQPCAVDADCGDVLHCDLTRAMPVCVGACDPHGNATVDCDGIAACGGLQGSETCGQPCGGGSTCGSASSCVGGACIPRCTTDADCATGMHCNPRIGACSAMGEDPTRLPDGRLCHVAAAGAPDQCRGACLGAPAIPGAPPGEGICVSLPPASGRCPDRGVVIGAAQLCNAVLCYDNCDCTGLSCSAEHLCEYPSYAPAPGECTVSTDAGTDASSDGPSDDAPPPDVVDDGLDAVVEAGPDAATVGIDAGAG